MSSQNGSRGGRDGSCDVPASPKLNSTTTIPLRRMGQPHEIGDLCAYLCSLQAGYITGQSIVVEGGINRSI
jgi:NAD(P)-dependent dehydrogenase (short-subunit alcohol dehydrogenase family)